MLWDLIRDFFVQYIFGGFTSSGQLFGGMIGQTYILDNGDFVANEMNTNYGFFNLGVLGYDDYLPSETFISLGDWLSTTATIIVMCLIIWFFIRLVIYFFRQGANLIKW